MDYVQGKDIVGRLAQGVRQNQAASFTKKEQESIEVLIRNDLVKPSAFQVDHKTRFGLQNLAEGAPVTRKGQVLFGQVGAPARTAETV